MNKHTIDEMIAILQAAKAGKDIQYYSELNKAWLECHDSRPSFNFSQDHYRVKPEPRVLYLKEYLGSGIDYGHVYSDDDYILPGKHTRIVKFVEQIPPS